MYICNNLFELIGKCVALAVSELNKKCYNMFGSVLCAKDHFTTLQLLVLVKIRFKFEKS